MGSNRAKAVVHCGFNNDPESKLVQRYAAGYGCQYIWQGIQNDLFRSADEIKYAKLAVIWNGSQHYGPSITRMCSRRGIPKCYIEWGMLPQSETFFVDPFGFCADSVLSSDLSWVNNTDVSKMLSKREELRAKYTIDPQGYVLVPMQIENDTQILHHSHYNNMEEYIEYVEYMYPKNRIIVKRHPKSPKKRNFERAEIAEMNTDILELASKAEVVVGITSTSLYECGILGVPVVALGDHPLRINKKENFEKVLAGALALNINRVNGDLRPILERFNIRPDL